MAVSTIGVREEKDFFLQGYGETLHRIKPEAIICYGAAFPEMKGKVIEVSYTESNRLSGHKKFWTVPADKNSISVNAAGPQIRAGGLYIVKTGGTILTGYGGGGGLFLWGGAEEKFRVTTNGRTSRQKKWRGN